MTLVTWEGTDVKPTANVQVLTATTTWTVHCKVYTLWLAFKDTAGNNLPSPVTSYSLQFPNSTTFTGRTALGYSQVQVGTLTISSILYLGSDVTPATNTDAFASSSTWIILTTAYAVSGPIVPVSPSGPSSSFQSSTTASNTVLQTIIGASCTQHAISWIDWLIQILSLPVVFLGVGMIVWARRDDNENALIAGIIIGTFGAILVFICLPDWIRLLTCLF